MEEVADAEDDGSDEGRGEDACGLEWKCCERWKEGGFGVMVAYGTHFGSLFFLPQHGLFLVVLDPFRLLLFACLFSISYGCSSRHRDIFSYGAPPLL